MPKVNNEKSTAYPNAKRQKPASHNQNIIKKPILKIASDNSEAYKMGVAFKNANPNATQADAIKEFDKWYDMKKAYDAGKTFAEQNPDATEAQIQKHLELTMNFLNQKNSHEKSKNDNL